MCVGGKLKPHHVWLRLRCCILCCMHPPYDCANLATFVWLQRVEDEEIASDTRDMWYRVWVMRAKQLVSHHLNVRKLSQRKAVAWEYFISIYLNRSEHKLHCISAQCHLYRAYRATATEKEVNEISQIERYRYADTKPQPNKRKDKCRGDSK